MIEILFWLLVQDILILLFVPLDSIAKWQDRAKSHFKKIKDKLNN